MPLLYIFETYFEKILSLVLFTPLKYIPLSTQKQDIHVYELTVCTRSYSKVRRLMR